jgi:hypothetical protein
MIFALLMALSPPPPFQPPTNNILMPPSRKAELPASTVTVSSDGKTIILAGPLETGSAERFKAVLDAVSTIEIVSLVSEGGKLDEAVKIYNSVKSRDLNTYVDYMCMSACTMIFLAGKKRIASPQAKFGFHQPYTLADTKISKQNAIDFMQRFYDDANVRPSFTDIAMSTPSISMWYPGFDEMLAANVVTDKTFGGETNTLFSLFKTKSDLSSALLNEPMFRALEKKFPILFNKIIDDTWDKKLEGAPDAEIGQVMRDTLATNLKTVLRGASDRIFSQYIILAGDQAQAARQLSYDACYLYTQGKLNIAQTLPKDLTNREIELINEALLEPYNYFEYKEPENSVFEKMFVGMSIEHVNALSDPENSNKIDVCNASIKMYQNISKLPYDEMVSISKSIFLSE